MERRKRGCFFWWWVVGGGVAVHLSFPPFCFVFFGFVFFFLSLGCAYLPPGLPVFGFPFFSFLSGGFFLS
ncbi:hypothetical protein, partial [Enterococcus faecium]